MGLSSAQNEREHFLAASAQVVAYSSWLAPGADCMVDKLLTQDCYVLWDLANWRWSDSWSRWIQTHRAVSTSNVPKVLRRLFCVTSTELQDDVRNVQCLITKSLF